MLAEELTKEIELPNQVKTWRERLDEAVARGRFTKEDHDTSLSFATCAISDVHNLVQELLPPKTWADRLEEAKARGSFTREDKRLACCWNTCAIGERDHLEHMSDREAYEYLSNLNRASYGGTFAQAVVFNEVDLAIQYYEKIHEL